MNANPTGTIRDAVTAVILCDGRLLMVRRQPSLNSFAGFTAFPGGKVDKADADAAASALHCDGQETRLMVGLVREAREELGIDLEALAAAGQVRAVHCLGEATTPPISPVRFRTHFYRVDLATAPEPVPDLGEIAEASWATPADWLARYRSGRLLLAPPTLDVLLALENDPAVTHIPALDEDNDRTGAVEALRSIEPLYQLRQLFVLSNTLPPAQHTNAFLIGDSHKVLVDPSPRDRAELQRLINWLDVVGVDEVLITHHHPDHREFANEIAERYDVPLSMSETTRKLIADSRYGAPGFFGELLLRTYEEGDVVTRWLGKPVRILAVPGHDAGQVALMPDSREWCIVGDLIQGVGTVVIHKPEGHMGTYFKTLQKVIDLDPAVIIPSHGQALGTVYRLEETLRHRRMREQAVLDLHRAGKSIDEMLPVIYAGVDPRLFPLARANIESHLDKLTEEGHLAA